MTRYKHMISPFLILIRVILLAIGGRLVEKTVLDQCFNKLTYRYTEVESKSILSCLRYFKYSINLIFKDPELQFLEHENIVYDSCADDQDERTFYMADLVPSEKSFVTRDKLGGQFTRLERLIVFTFLCAWFMVLFPISLFSKDRGKIGLILLELTENAHLIKVLDSSSVIGIYFFDAYNRDSIFLCYLLKKHTQITISIIPSSNPIATFYPVILADQFMFTTPYQVNEYENLKANWIGEINTLCWPPFGYQETIIKKKDQHSFQYKLGFLSSASALRRHLNHHFFGGAKEERAELKLINSLVNIVEEKGYSILIYLHPIEKRSKENLEFSLKYYRNLFGDQVEFADFSKTSKESFHLAEICISGFSSSQFERLFGGFKAILAPMGEMENHFLDDSLIPITADSYIELTDMIDRHSKLTEEDFFSISNLCKYHWSWYLEKYPTLKLRIDN